MASKWKQNNVAQTSIVTKISSNTFWVLESDKDDNGDDDDDKEDATLSPVYVVQFQNFLSIVYDTFIRINMTGIMITDYFHSATKSELDHITIDFKYNDDDKKTFGNYR